MKLKYIELNNIGLYKNKRITFSSGEEKEILLVWGNNGAGKTTFINSVKAGLLGLKGYNCTYDEYCQLIKDTLVSSRCDKVDLEASIKIAIIIKEQNREREYVICRKWHISNEEFSEKVDVYLDEVLLDFERKDLFLIKISKLIPTLLLDVIIFDGEKAINILNENQMDKLIKSIIYSVFGIDSYVQLYKDLNSYLRNTKYGNDASSEETIRYLNLENEYKSIYSRRNKLLNMLETEEKKRQVFARQTIQLMNRFSDRTGIEVENISEINETLSDIETKKEKMDSEIKYINEEILPLKLLHARIKQIINDAEEEKPYLALNKINDLKDYFSNSKKALSLINQLESLINTDKASSKYNLSDAELQSILSIDSVLENYKKEDLLNNIDEKNNLIDELRNKISISGKAEDEESKKILASLDVSYKNLSEIKTNLKNLAEELAKCSDDLDEAKEYYDVAKQELSKKKKTTNAYVNAALYRDAIDEFITEIIKTACSKLNKQLLEALQGMKFRNNSITGVDISPKTFALSLYENNHSLIQSKLFSAGEKQVLLGLIIKESLAISQIDTFFMFDTPVGRLDAKNRKLFTEEVIFKTADQVAIFATDSDYSKTDYSRIKKKLTKEMVLTRDESDSIVMKNGSIY